MNLYTSDLHLFHKNVTAEGTNFDNRPFQTLVEMHEAIKQRWNTKVTNADTVYILGDIVWKMSDEAIALVSTLRGRKVLCLGNHDRDKDARFLQLFSEIVPYKEVDDHVGDKNYKVILSHYPIAFWNGMHRGNIHLFGHVHNSGEQKDYQKFLAEISEKYGEKYIARNVGCMHWNYEPVTLEEIMKKRSD